MRYTIVESESGPNAYIKGILCYTCGRTSWHPMDVEKHYCGFCHIFHDDPERNQRDEAMRDPRSLWQ